MATLTQPKANKGLLVYSYKSNSKTVIAATHITSYKELPDNELLVISGADVNRFKFIDKADCDAAIIIIDGTMNITSTEAFVAT